MKKAALVTVGITALLSIFTAIPATAGGSLWNGSCNYYWNGDTSTDKAWTLNLNGQCERLGVRAKFSPQSTSTTVDTGWIYKYNYAASVSTGAVKELQTSYHSGRP